MKQKSLFGNLPKLEGKMKDINREIVQRANNPRQRKTYTARGGNNRGALQTRVSVAVETARQTLIDDGTLKLITNEDDLKRYMKKVNEYGIAALDTETTGLDPINDKLVGYSIYVPGEKPAYVPIYHTDIQENLVDGNINIDTVSKEFQTCIDNDVGFIFHNAKFDMRVLHQNLELTDYVKCIWDTQVAGNLLNEIEPHGLDALWEKYCNNGEKVGNAYGNLFKNIPFNYIPIDVAYLYAAFDTKMTWELYEFQEKFLNPESNVCKERDLVGVARVWHEIELPIIPYLCEMEDTGVPIDEKVAKELSDKYNAMLIQAESDVQEHIQKIDLSVLPLEERSKLTNPINPGSPQQLAIIFYDALKWKSTDRRKPRGTGEEIIEGLKDKYPEHKDMLEAILNYRGVKKLLSTYIEKIPSLVKEKTGKVHTQFNQYGARTGRFSSQDPNLQNIPSRNREIRKMFTSPKGTVLLGADYSQQEPRVLAHLCYTLFNDTKMMDAYIEGRDLYSWMASQVYKVPYEECFSEKNGKPYPEGEQRRESVKSIILGLMYGRSNQSVAGQLGWTVQETNQVVDSFFDSFPAIRQVINYYQTMASKVGYVQTIYGRKRRLPEMTLPEFEFVHDEDRTKPITDGNIISYYQNRMKNAWGRDKQAIRDEAQKRGIWIVDNGYLKSEAERQCLNSVIQGSSADITKKAMVEIGRNKEIRELGFKMLLTVHDEVIGEVPRENAKKAGKILEDIMISVTEGTVAVPMRVDVEYTERWFGDDISEHLHA